MSPHKPEFYQFMIFVNEDEDPFIIFDKKVKLDDAMNCYNLLWDIFADVKLMKVGLASEYKIPYYTSCMEKIA